MTQLVFLRHGLTQWNVERRLQGRRDIPLNDDGREMVAAWRLPSHLINCPIVASPLIRSMETAEILKSGHPELGAIETDQRLMEKSWGIWEGRNLHEMETTEGDNAHDPAHRPENGESRRDMLGRIGEFLADAAQQDGPRIVVTHRGVIRTVYGIATGWNLSGETPDEMSRRRGQVFEATADGSATIEQLNLPLKG
ncbi:MAG: histidine phosphatase family protein [Alphaproteobacteria bacterium]|nr:histidine phosphatase family protein [Alphaproteobacteria bacterium]